MLTEIFAKYNALDLMLACRVENTLKGNCDWRIRVDANRLRFPPMENTRDNSLSGFVACHRLGDFTTYAVSIAGHEVWFDKVEPALTHLADNLTR